MRQVTCPLRRQPERVQFSAKFPSIPDKGLNMNLRNGLCRNLALMLSVATPLSSFADFKYTETTKVTGGSLVSMAKFASAFGKQSRSITDPVESTILVKGNRMARINADHTEIIDLDAETITQIYPDKKQYSVMTFQEMKQAMENAMKQMQQQQAQQPKTTSNGQPMPEMKFNATVTNTGQSKDV